MTINSSTVISSEYLFERSDRNSTTSSLLLGVQIFSAFFLFILTFIVGIAPIIFLKIWSQRGSNRSGSDSDKTSLSLRILLFFGGGVLLAISFVHIIPEIQENWEDYEAKNHHFDVPIIELAICGGFFLIYFIEELMFILIGHDHHGDGQTLGDPNSQDSNNLSNLGLIDPLSRNRKITWPMFLRGLLTILGFSVHSIFDGVVIGIQKTSSSLWTVFFAIFLHKTVVAMAVCMDLYEKNQNMKLLSIHMSIFSIMSPLGILMIAFAEDYISDEKSLPIMLLSAISVGTIIYIVFFEILTREKISSLSGMRQFFVVVLGFIVMTLISISISDE